MTSRRHVMRKRVSVVGVLAAATLAATALLLGACSGGSPNPAPEAVVQVPVVTGLTLGEARSALQLSGLHIEQTREPTPDAPAGVVVSQTPAAGTRVLVGATVQVSISSGPAGS
jgi:serine/threonine-protein kinase